MMRVRVGTSGYNYPEWRGSFYPETMPTKSMFAYYAERFSTVEINYTFRRMPTAKTVTGWLNQAPPGFSYTLKAPQSITHIRRLADTGELLGVFIDNARLLGTHLGTLLFQLPPHFKCDLVRLEGFLSLLPADVRAAFEFRHDSWLTDDVYALLAERNAALVIADFGDRTTPMRPTAHHGYLRLRDEGYTPADLERWADRLLAEGGVWKDVFVYFKHEEAGKGPDFARTFIDILFKRGVMVR
jgi:uncharacterized protein YecE (DUF72 family)